MTQHEGQKRTLATIRQRLRDQQAFHYTREVLYQGDKAKQFVAETAVVLTNPAQPHRRGQKRRPIPGPPVALRLVISEVRDEMPDAVKEFDPTCRFRGFGPEGMLAAVTIRIDRYQDRAPVVSEVVERLHRALAEGGIELAGGASVTPSKPA